MSESSRSNLGDVSGRISSCSVKSTMRSSISGMNEMTSRSTARSTASNLSEKGFEKLSPMHEKLLDGLLSSSFLSPVHVDVRNDSYWYNMRAKLKPKRHLAIAVKYSEQYARWESFIYKMKLREEDMEMAPKKVSVGNSKTKWGAYKSCDAACKERDENPARNKKMADILHADRIQSTHFRVLVVSERFERMSYIERVALVHQELVKAIGVNCIPAMAEPTAATAADDDDCDAQAAAAYTAAAVNDSRRSARTGSSRSRGKQRSSRSGGSRTGSRGDGGGESREVSSRSGGSRTGSRGDGGGESREGSRNWKRSRTPTDGNGATKASFRSPETLEYVAAGTAGTITSTMTTRGGGANKITVDAHSVPAPGLGRCAPTRMKIASVFGPHVCALDLFRFLLPDDGNPLHLMVSALTPSQWRPEIYNPPVSERLGPAHLGLRTLQIMNSAKPKSQKIRVKKLTTVVDHYQHQREMLIEQVAKEKEAKREAKAAGGSKRGISSPPHQQLNGHRPLSSGESVGSLGTAGGEMQPVAGDFGAPSGGRRSGEKGDGEGGSRTKGAIMADSLGLDPAVSGVRYKKLGGIYGHFFNDLSPSVKEMVMNRYKNNKDLIRDESNTEVLELHAKLKKERLDRQSGDSGVPLTNLARMRAKVAANSVSGLGDRGTESEMEMMQEVNISNLKMERIAVRLQRQRRLAVYRRAVKLLWWRQYAAITVQRLVRGVFGRQYAQLFQALRPKAAVRIQRCYRDSRSRVFLRQWQWLSYRLTRWVLPKIKRFIRNCFLSWIYTRNHYAVKIQAVVRGFNGRVIFYKRAGHRHYYAESGVFPVAALLIQRIARGFLGRRRFHRHVELLLVERIDIPAAVRLQRIYRGRLAKVLLKQLKIEMKCCLLLQGYVRAAVRRRWNLQMAYERRRKNAATLIQKMYRGRIDRLIFRYMAHEHWYETVYIPSIILVQSSTRRYFATLRVKDLRQKNRSARAIQICYINYVQRKFAKAVLESLKSARLFRCTSLIQRNIRRWLCLISYRRKKLQYDGKITLAAKVITRAWARYQVSRKFQVMMDEHRLGLYRMKVNKIEESRLDVQEDINEIKKDVNAAVKLIDRQKERIKLIETFELQASLRSTKVKQEMGMLTVDDFERGKPRGG